MCLSAVSKGATLPCALLEALIRWLTRVASRSDPVAPIIGPTYSQFQSTARDLVIR